MPEQITTFLILHTIDLSAIVILFLFGKGALGLLVRRAKKVVDDGQEVANA